MRRAVDGNGRSASQADEAAVLESKPVAAEPLAVLSHTDRPNPRGTTLPDFIAYDQPSNTFRLVGDALKAYGVTPKINFYSTCPEVMLRLVLLGKGTAALPYLLVREYIKTGHLKRLDGKIPWLIPRKIVALKRRDRQLPLALKHVIHQTTAVLETLLQEARER